MFAKKLIFFMLFVFFAAALSGCAFVKSLYPAEDAKNIALPLSPLAPAGSGYAQNIALYFGYQDEDMLSAETRFVGIPLDERQETHIIRLLIQGPSSSHAELRGLFNPAIQVVSVNSQGRNLTVTLSSEFLHAPPEAPANWREDPALVEDLRKRNRLALYSIVNTITELGKYDRVQLQVETADIPSAAQRLKKSDLGLGTGNKDNSLLGPIGRAYEYILSPSRIANIVLEAWSQKDWERLYLYLAAQEAGGEPRPTREEMQSALGASSISTIKNVTVLDATISRDGAHALICLDFEYLRSDGKTDSQKNALLKLVREEEAWKAAYSSLKSLGILQQ